MLLFVCKNKKDLNLTEKLFDSIIRIIVLHLSGINVKTKEEMYHVKKTKINEN